jgi:hypothetical protein
MSYNLKIPKYIIAIAKDPEQNIHGLTAKQIADRLYTHKWSLEQCLSTPMLTRREAGKRGARKSPWGRWSPGEFTAADKIKRGGSK